MNVALPCPTIGCGADLAVDVLIDRTEPVEYSLTVPPCACGHEHAPAVMRKRHDATLTRAAERHIANWRDAHRMGCVA